MKKIVLPILILFVASNGQAGLITHTDYSSQGAITAAGQNANENAIFNEFNGNIESANIKDGTIVAADIAGATITGAKIAAGTITDSLMTANTLSNASISSGTINGSTANSSATQGTIHQGTISTPDLRANAVTQSIRADDNSKGANGANTADSQSITTIGGPVLAIANVEIGITAGGAGWGWNICISTSTTCAGGSQQDFNTTSPTSGGQTGDLSSTALLTLAAGTYTFTSKWAVINGSGAALQKHSLTLIELRD